MRAHSIFPGSLLAALAAAVLVPSLASGDTVEATRYDVLEAHTVSAKL